jgi:hypothetical protein
MKKQYRNASLYDAKPKSLGKTEMQVYWGNPQNRVYLTASQAIRFIRLSKDSDIN